MSGLIAGIEGNRWRSATVFAMLNFRRLLPKYRSQ
jgi:hypothetical protein